MSDVLSLDNPVTDEMISFVAERTKKLLISQYHAIKRVNEDLNLDGIAIPSVKCVEASTLINFEDVLKLSKSKLLKTPGFRTSCLGLIVSSRIYGYEIKKLIEMSRFNCFLENARVGDLNTLEKLNVPIDMLPESYAKAARESIVANAAADIVFNFIKENTESIADSLFEFRNGDADVYDCIVDTVNSIESSVMIDLMETGYDTIGNGESIKVAIVIIVSGGVEKVDIESAKSLFRGKVDPRAYEELVKYVASTLPDREDGTIDFELRSLE